MNHITDELGFQLERNFVQSTYEDIAQDFSDTRYKKWPKVDAFLESLDSGSLTLDVGCGNGKYLNASRGYNIGCDISTNLLQICKSRKFEVVLCDMSRLPFRKENFDALICIASLHHLATKNRRQQCLDNMIQLLAPESRILVQVWSYEQDVEKNNPYLKKLSTSSDSTSSDVIEIFNDIALPVHKNRTAFENQDVLVPFHKKSTDSSNDVKTSDGFGPINSRPLRYYHVFRKGELDQMFEFINGISIEESYYDKGNWCIIGLKGPSRLRM